MPAPASEANKNLDRLVYRIGEISILPHTMLQIIQVTNDPLSSIADLTRVIRTDPALSATILRYANSVTHGLVTRIDGLQQAIGYLGFSRVRNLAISASVCAVFRRDVKIGTYSRRELWDHLVAVAITSRMLSEHLDVPNPEDVFLSGLLHDIGIILEDQYYHEHFSELMNTFPEGKTLVEAEQEKLGFDHTALGAIIAEQWRLPEVVRDTIRQHHNEFFHGYHAQTIACIALANLMVTTKGIRSVGIPLRGISPAVHEHLGLRKEDIAGLVEKMNQQLQQNQDLFNLISDEQRQKLSSPGPR